MYRVVRKDAMARSADPDMERNAEALMTKLFKNYNKKSAEPGREFTQGPAQGY